MRPVSRAAWRRRDGVLLPMALVYLLILTMVAGAGLALSGTERRLAEGDLEWLRGRIALREGLTAPAPASGAPEVSLLHGYSLVLGAASGASESSGSPGLAHLWWTPDPDGLARSVAGRVEAGWGAVQGVQVGEADCGPSPLPPGRVRAPDPVPAPDPPLPPHPRLGPLGIEKVVEFAVGGVTVLPAGAEVQGGRFVGLLLSMGDLHIQGDAVIEGLVMTSGSLRVGSQARLRGGALVGGGLTIEPGARVEVCPTAVASALEGAGFGDPIPLGPEGYLGSF